MRRFAEEVKSLGMAAKYDCEAEYDCLQWFQGVLGVTIDKGPANVQRALKNGQYMVQLCQKVQAGTANCPPKAKKMRLKPNTQDAPFKQMENIQTFLNFCVAYGVPKNSLFPTIDLYENRNMAGVLAGIQLLGTECQRHGFNGPTCGAAPTEQNLRGNRGARGGAGARGGTAAGRAARGGAGGRGGQQRGFGKRKMGGDHNQGQTKKRLTQDGNWGAQPIAQQPLNQSEGYDSQWYQDSYGQQWG